MANVGDSRAVLVYERSDGTLATEQLSHDHTVDSEAELCRLERLGLDRRQLQRCGRLGTHECTRSIGDYSVKRGYRDVDALRCGGGGEHSSCSLSLCVSTVLHSGVPCMMS